MAEQVKRKYSALAELTNSQATETSETRLADAGLRLPMKPTKLQGKRSDPDWKQFSILLKKESHKQAGLILRQKYDGIDISDLMQALLDQWLKNE